MFKPRKGCGIETAMEYQDSLLSDLKKTAERMKEHNKRLDERHDRIARGLCPECGLLVCDHKPKK